MDLFIYINLFFLQINWIFMIHYNVCIITYGLYLYIGIIIIFYICQYINILMQYFYIYFILINKFLTLQFNTIPYKVELARQCITRFLHSSLSLIDIGSS